MFQTSNIIYSIAFSPDGKKIASGGQDGFVRLWDLTNSVKTMGRDCKLKSEMSQIIGKHDGFVYSIAFSPNGKTIVSGGKDNTVRLWDLTDGTSQIIGRHDGSVSSVAFSPDGKKIVSGGHDNIVRLWDLVNETGQIIGRHDYWVFSVAFSPDGKKIVSGGDDCTVRLWNLDCFTSGNKVDCSNIFTKPSISEKNKMVGRHRDGVFSVAFSPDGKKIASGGIYDYIKLWDFTYFNHQVMGEHDWVYSLVFSPDGKKIVSGGSDGMIKLWDLSRYYVCNIVARHDVMYSIAFSPDGKKIASGGYAGIRIYINPFWVRDIKKSLC